MFQPFEIGQQVQLKKGWTPMWVRAVDWATRRHPRTGQKFEGWWIRAQYPKSVSYFGAGEDGWEDWRPAEDYVPLNDEGEVIMTEEVNEGVANGALFQTKEAKPRFGTKIAINSQGKIVLEMKGKDGEVEAFDAEAIEEVVPHTALFKKLGTNGTGKVEVHLQVPAGSVSKNDILIDTSIGNIFTVKDTDTKRRDAGKPTGKFVKLATEEVSFG